MFCSFRTLEYRILPIDFGSSAPHLPTLAREDLSIGITLHVWNPTGIRLQFARRNSSGNTSLRSLQLYPTGLLFCPDRDSILPCVQRALSRNYTIQDLHVGHRSPLLEMYLGLNRAGRIHWLLQDQDNNVSPVDGAAVLAKSSQQSPDILYWFLRNDGTGRLFR